MLKNKLNILKLFIPLLFIFIYLIPLNSRGLWSPDELRYAEIAREVVVNDNWIVPTFNQLRYFEKPIFGHWFNAASLIVFGEHNFSVRFSSVFSTFIAALAIFFLVRRYASNVIAWLSAGIYVSLLLVTILGTYAALDSVLSMWLTLAFVSFFLALDVTHHKHKFGYYTLAGICCGGAFLTKGFLALALPVLVVLPYAIWHKRFKELLYYGCWTVIVASLVIAPWGIAIYRADADFWHYFFWVEHIQRFSGNNAQHAAPFWYYLPIALLATLPWIFFIPNVLTGLRSQANSPLIKFSILWAIIPFLFFSLAKGKLPTYILPCMAPIAILFAHGLYQAYHNHANTLNTGLLALSLSFSLILIALSVLMFTDKLPFQTSEQWKFWGLFGAFAWAFLCSVMARYVVMFEYKICWIMATFALLFMVVGQVLPNKTIYSKIPGSFVQQLQPLVKQHTMLIADYPSTMSALNWYLKREDVYLTNSGGEVTYGLSYPDAQQRFIPLNQLARRITQARQKTSVLMMIRELKTLPVNLPTPSKRIKQGRFMALYYDRQP